MSEVLDGIRQAVGQDNLSESLSRDECGVDAAGLPAQRVVVNADLAFPAHRWPGSRCDFIIFFPVADERYVVTAPLELKSGRANVSQVSPGNFSREPISPRSLLLRTPSVDRF